MFIKGNYEIVDITRIGIESLQLETVQFAFIPHMFTKERFINYTSTFNKYVIMKKYQKSKQIYILLLIELISLLK